MRDFPTPLRTPPAAAPVEARVPAMGVALPADVRTRFESRLGYDFAAVRIHADDGGRNTLALGARATTFGNRIAVAPGFLRLSPHDPLLAHELVHVAQQADTSGAPAGYASVEAEAERNAAIVAAGGRASPVLRIASDTLHRADLTEADVERLPYDQLPALIAGLEQRVADGAPADEVTRLSLLGAAAARRLIRERPMSSRAAAMAPPPMPADQPSPVAEIDRFLHDAGIDGEGRERLRAFIRAAPSPEGTVRALLPQAPADMIGKIADWAGAGAATERADPPIPGPVAAAIRRALRLPPGAYLSRARLADLYRSLQYPPPGEKPLLAGDERARVMDFLFRTLPPPADPDPVVADTVGGGQFAIGRTSIVQEMQEQHRRAVRLETLDAVRGSAAGTAGALAARAAGGDEETIAAAAKIGQTLGQLGHLYPGTRHGSFAVRHHDFEAPQWGARIGPAPGFTAAAAPPSVLRPPSLPSRAGAYGGVGGRSPVTTGADLPGGGGQRAGSGGGVRPGGNAALPGAYTVLSTDASGTILSDRAMSTTSVAAHPDLAAVEAAMGRAGITFLPNGQMAAPTTAAASYLRVLSPSGERFDRARIEYDPRTSVLQDVWHELNHVQDFRAGKAPPMRFVRAATEEEFVGLRARSTVDLFRIAEAQLKQAGPKPPMELLRSRVRLNVNEARNYLRDMEELPRLGRGGYVESSGNMVVRYHTRLRALVETGNVAGTTPLQPAERRQLAAYVRSYVQESFPELPAEFERFFPQQRFWDMLKGLE